MVGYVDIHEIKLALPLKHLYGLTEDVPDIEVVSPLEAVNFALAESDVSLLTVLSQPQWEVLPVVATAPGLETRDELLPHGGVHQPWLALARIQAVEMSTRSTNLITKLQGGRSNSRGTSSGVNQLLRDQDLQKRT